MSNFNKYWAPMESAKIVKLVYGATPEDGKDYKSGLRQVERERKAFEEGREIKSTPRTKALWDAAMSRENAKLALDAAIAKAEDKPGETPEPLDFASNPADLAEELTGAEVPHLLRERAEEPAELAPDLNLPILDERMYTTPRTVVPQILLEFVD